MTVLLVIRIPLKSNQYYGLLCNQFGHSGIKVRTASNRCGSKAVYLILKFHLAVWRYCHMLICNVDHIQQALRQHKIGQLAQPCTIAFRLGLDFWRVLLTVTHLLGQWSSEHTGKTVHIPITEWPLHFSSCQLWPTKPL